MEAMIPSYLDMTSGCFCISPKQRSPLPACPLSSFSCLGLRSSSPRLSGMGLHSGLAVSGQDGGGGSLRHKPACSSDTEASYPAAFNCPADDLYCTAEVVKLPPYVPVPGGGWRRLDDEPDQDTFYGDAVDLLWTDCLESTVAGAAPFNDVMGCTLGKMISRKKLDFFFFSTLFVSSFSDLIVPSAAFASDHHRYMFNLGHYTPLATLFTFGLKAAMVAALGFAAGLAISSGLVWLQNRMDPYLATALKWGLHMGLSSNFRYQVLKGLEFLMARVLTPAGFKDLVAVALCWLNNVLGKILTPKDTDLLETEFHSKSDAKEYHVNDWGEGASPSGNIRRSKRLVHLKFLVPGGKWVCEVSVLRCLGSGGVIFDISVSPFFGSI